LTIAGLWDEWRDRPLGKAQILHDDYHRAK
jgi:hypothetical protein